MGFLCADHVREVREGRHGKRYVISTAEGDEIVIDLEPLEIPEGGEPGPAKPGDQSN